MLLRDFLSILFPAVHLRRSGKPSRDRLCHEWNKPSWTAGKPGRMPYLTTQMNLSQQIRHTSLWMFALFHAPGVVFFFWGCFFLLRIFFLDFSLNMPLLPFTSIFASFSWYASGGHSRSGRKGNSGIGRESKVKPPVSAKNLQPCG